MRVEHGFILTVNCKDKVNRGRHQSVEELLIADKHYHVQTYNINRGVQAIFLCVVVSIECCQGMMGSCSPTRNCVAVYSHLPVYKF
jgi:hypothetical protein